MKRGFATGTPGTAIHHLLFEPRSGDRNVVLEMPTIRERYEGCLLGLAVGDALGGLFESQLAEHLLARFPTVSHLIAHPKNEIWYTDDTQMAIGVAEALLERGRIEEDSLCRAFVANYVPSRGYGRGARAVLEAMEDGGDHRAVAENHFPGGSYGNGAAMRVAPVGICFRNDEQALMEEARKSALPTHVHPLGIEGAQLLALAVALAANSEVFNHVPFFDRLIAASSTVEFRSKLEQARGLQSTAELSRLGNGIQALESVVTSIASFALSPDSFQDTIGSVILLGGDTDTLAAMAGAVSGAYLGITGLPSRLTSSLETSPKGREYIRTLAAQLHAKFG